jgi:large subunit ribosomal protein L12
MEYIHTALLLQKLGKQINEINVKKVLEAAGATVEEAKIKALVTALDGVDIEKVIKEASVMPTAAVQQAPKEAKKEEVKEEKKNDEAAAAGLGSLFG